jgi:flagellar biosynthesis protein FliP
MMAGGNAAGLRTVFVRILNGATGRRLACALLLAIGVAALFAFPALAQTPDRPPTPEVPSLPKITFVEGTDNPEDVTIGIKFLLLLSFFSVAPSFIIMATSFTRVLIVLTFVKRAMGTQDLPPNQVTATLALFLTFFIMAPTIKAVKEAAWDPYQAQEITTLEAYERGIEPVRVFMLKQTRQKDLALFVRLSGLPRPRNAGDVPTWVIVPSFMISELTTAFLMGVYVFLPFIVIDMVVASTLMSMGMIMLPPVLISLPFKILLFILVDGWNLVALSVVKSFTQ